MKKRILSFVLVIVLCISQFGCGVKKAKRTIYDGEDFDLFCEELFKDDLRDSPVNTRYKLKNPEVYGIEFDEEDYVYPFYTMEDIRETNEKVKDNIARLKCFDRESLSEVQQINYDNIEWLFNNSIMSEDEYYMYNMISPLQGVIVNLSIDFMEYPISNETDIKNYLHILTSLPDLANNLEDFLFEQVKRGYFPNDFVVDENISNIDKMINSGFISYVDGFNAKAEKIGLNDKALKEYLQTNEEYVEKYVKPAYLKMKDTLTSLKGSTKHEGRAIDYGKEYLDFFEKSIRIDNGVDMSVDEIKDYLINRYKKLSDKFILLAMNNYDEFAEISELKLDYDSNSDIVEELIDFSNMRLNSDFTNGFQISYMVKSCEIDGVLAYYLNSALDDLSDNIIRVNKSYSDLSSIDNYITVSHESAPGHMLMHNGVCLAGKLCNFNLNNSNLGAKEGWAEFSSYLALDNLVKKGKITQIQKEMYILYRRMIRVIESACAILVNYYGYSAKQLNETFSGTALTLEYEMIYKDLISGEKTSIPYAFGPEKVFDIYEKAGEDREELFFDFMLTYGCMPISLLEKWSDQFCQSAKK